MCYIPCALEWIDYPSSYHSGLPKGVEETDCPQFTSLCLNLLENVQERVSFLVN